MHMASDVLRCRLTEYCKQKEVKNCHWPVKLHLHVGPSICFIHFLNLTAHGKPLSHVARQVMHLDFKCKISPFPNCVQNKVFFCFCRTRPRQSKLNVCFCSVKLYLAVLQERQGEDNNTVLRLRFRIFIDLLVWNNIFLESKFTSSNVLFCSTKHPKIFSLQPYIANKK